MVGRAVQGLRRHVPRPLAILLRRGRRRAGEVARRTGLRRRLRPVRWGNLRRRRPISTRYGRDRGTPVDRRFLDAFYASHAADIRGRVLEVRDPAFSGRFGSAVAQLDIVDIDPTNEQVTILADLAEPGSLPDAAFDCVIVPQTLQYTSDLARSCQNLWSSLAPGGVLLLTVPAMAKLDHHLRDVDRWRVTPAGLDAVLRSTCPGAEIQVSGRGNVLAAVAFLMGVSAEELSDAELDDDDPGYPIVSLARVKRGS